MTPTGTRTLGLICVIFAALCIGVWIPLDTDTGLIEQVRRRVEIGDALAPTLAATFILLGGMGLILGSGRAGQASDPMGTTLGFAAAMLAILVLGFLVMLYAGPLALSLRGEPLEYRLMRDTFPWKYIGFGLGGVLAISGMISLAERRVTGRAILISIGAVLAMIALFDLPFDDLLLPPNGDY